MTRKDYVLLAAALKAARGFCETHDQRRGTERATLCVASALARDNAAFDKPRFLAAAGVHS
jgi:hypothetical protein